MRAITVLLCLFAFGCDDDTAPTAMDLSIPADMAAGNVSAARGQYLVAHVLLCGSCHTTPDSTGQPSTAASDFLAGGRGFTVGNGKMVYAPNLTPDPTTGLGSWTQSQIVDAIVTGVDNQGNPLHPIMPYYMFHNLTSDDANSIAVYLKSLTPRSHAVPNDTATVAMAAPVVMDSLVPHTTLAASDPNHASAERGRYIAEVSCLECHTERGSGGMFLALGKAFAGGAVFTVGGETLASANLTPDSASGLGTWSVADIVAALKTDRERGTGRMLCPPMPGGPSNLGGMTDPDLTDVANYIHTLPTVSNGPFGCNDAGVPLPVPDGG
jgi:mono/diheme cytochrome c family protein